MKTGIIDLGTNTFQLLISELQDSDFTILKEQKTPVRIGENGINRGEITPEAMSRAMLALESFFSQIQLHQVDKVLIAGTSAIRNAANGLELVKKIKEKWGVETWIISGKQEAELIYQGVKLALNRPFPIILVMDIGGGSVEFIIGSDKEIVWKESFEIGVQRLKDKFHHQEPIELAEVHKLNNFLREELYPLKDAILKHQPRMLVGSSGTFDTLIDMYFHKKGFARQPGEYVSELPRDEYIILHDEMIQKNQNERSKIPGMAPMRVDMIVVATCLLHFVLEEFKIEKMLVSGFSLKEGLLAGVLNEK